MYHGAGDNCTRTNPVRGFVPYPQIGGKNIDFVSFRIFSEGKRMKMPSDGRSRTCFFLHRKLTAMYFADPYVIHCGGISVTS
jgi:hypothetical protein